MTVRPIEMRMLRALKRDDLRLPCGQDGLSVLMISFAPRKMIQNQRLLNVFRVIKIS